MFAERSASSLYVCPERTPLPKKAFSDSISTPRAGSEYFIHFPLKIFPWEPSFQRSTPWSLCFYSRRTRESKLDLRTRNNFKPGWFPATESKDVIPHHSLSTVGWGRGAAQEDGVSVDAPLLHESPGAEFFLCSDDKIVLPVSVRLQAWHLNRKWGQP